MRNYRINPRYQRVSQQCVVAGVGEGVWQTFITMTRSLTPTIDRGSEEENAFYAADDASYYGDIMSFRRELFRELIQRGGGSMITAVQGRNDEVTLMIKSVEAFEDFMTVVVNCWHQMHPTGNKNPKMGPVAEAVEPSPYMRHIKVYIDMLLACKQRPKRTFDMQRISDLSKWERGIRRREIDRKTKSRQLLNQVSSDVKSGKITFKMAVLRMLKDD